MTNTSSFSLEVAIKRIKEIQTLLQDGQLSFDQSLKLFEEADSLIKWSQQYLTESEIRIQQVGMSSGDD